MKSRVLTHIKLDTGRKLIHPLLKVKDYVWADVKLVKRLGPSLQYRNFPLKTKKPRTGKE